MDTRTVLLIRSPDLGWAAVDAALRGLPGAEVVGETRCLVRGVELVRTRRPDVVLAPARLDGRSTRPALSSLRTALPRPPLVLLFGGGIDEEELAGDGLAIDGHLLWHELSAETLGPLLAAFLSGEVVVASRSVLAAFVRSRGGPTVHHHGGEVPALTPRERSMLAGLVQGLSRKDLATREGVSPRTVERVVSDLHAKLGTSNPYALVARAIGLGLVDASSRSP